MIKVGFDYDEPIFTWYDYAHDVSVREGLADPQGEPPTEWDPTTTYGCTLDDWYDVLNREVLKGNDGMYAWPVNPDVVKMMRYMYATGRYEIHLITARGHFGSYGDDIKRLTQSQIIREGIPYDSLTFTEDKGREIRLRGLNYFLDDRDKYFTEAEEAGAEAYLLDERWNRDFEAPPGRRVASTEEYIRRIMNRHGRTRVSLTKPQISRLNRNFDGPVAIL